MHKRVCTGLSLLCAAVLFGPCAYIRYAYPLALCAPALLGLGLARSRGEN